ncbi:MAG: hypothetical protein K9W44_07900 [Candidatus Lokiarchaeota archaeon]|nr:hypothetical protein [Candidatus Harpocratesius repetitus]
MPGKNISHDFADELSNLSLEHFSHLVSYLKSHVKDIPFNFSTIAGDLGWSIDRVHAMFMLIRDLYQLFRVQEEELAQKMNNLYILKNDPSTPITLKMTEQQLQDLVDFHFLTSKRPQSLITLQKIPRLHQLILDYPPLFHQVEGKGGWELNESGKMVSEQFKRFQRVHIIPENIIAKTIFIEIIH